MEEADKSVESQERRTSKLAVISLLLVIPFVAVSIAIFIEFTFGESIPENMPLVPALMLLALVLAGLVLGGVSLHRISKSEGMLKGRAIALIAIILVMFSFVLRSQCGGVVVHYSDHSCRVRLYALKVAFASYAYDNDARYPTPSKWCDLMKDYVLEGHLMCPAKWATREACSYALNPNAHPNSPADMVLLFETKGGWNQFGGPELLSTENHPNIRSRLWGYKVSGCNVLFSNGRARFVIQKDFDDLKWEVDQEKQ
jgi:hypothetical protein